MSTREAAFQAALDAEPDNGSLRQVFADYLDDIDDPRGPGYRALGRLGIRPIRIEMESGGGTMWIYGGRECNIDYKACFLSDDWYHLCQELCHYRVSSGHPGPWCFQRTRQRAEDAAALAWSRLTAEQQDEILPPIEVPA